MNRHDNTNIGMSNKMNEMDQMSGIKILNNIIKPPNPRQHRLCNRYRSRDG
jgi:hypothetical protein